MKDALYSLAFIVVFSLIGGFFSAAETSLVTLRESQISRFAVTRGRRGVKLAELASNPNRFLAAGQVGVTLSGFISAGYGSARIVPVLSPPLQSLGLSQGLASTAAFLAVTVSITYISLVLGELVPKRIALQRTEGVALLAAGPVDMLARAAKPFIWLL
jgi:putative hemolysin